MNKFKNLPISEKPRERFVKYGKENISIEDLIMIILKTGIKDSSIKEIANNLLLETKGIIQLRNLNLNNLTKIKGIGQVKAIELLSAIELGRRIYYEKEITNKLELTDPEIIYEHFYHLFQNNKQEEFYVIYLDNKKKYLDKKMLFKGTINSSLIHPREVFKEAYLLSASFIICIHNHPSGDSSPSIQDLEVTKTLGRIGDIHGIKVIDHIIIGDNNYYSFFENNKI